MTPTIPLILLYLNSHSTNPLCELPSTHKRPQNHKWKSTKLVASYMPKFQGRKPRTIPGPLLLRLCRALVIKTLARKSVSRLQSTKHWKKDCPQMFYPTLPHQLKYLPSEEDPSQGWENSERYFSKLVFLNIQGETKIEINKGTCQILINTRVTYTLNFKHCLLQSLQIGSWGKWLKLVKGDNFYQSQFSGISVMSRQ